jgi:hypothetical protein
MINDLKLNEIDLWKYVDDTNLAGMLPKDTSSKSNSQLINEIYDQCNPLKRTLREDKCKEMRIELRGRLYERWISYPVDKSYPMDKSPIQWIAICRIKMRCTKHG